MLPFRASALEGLSGLEQRILGIAVRALTRLVQLDRAAKLGGPQDLRPSGKQSLLMPCCHAGTGAASGLLFRGQLDEPLGIRERQSAITLSLPDQHQVDHLLLRLEARSLETIDEPPALLTGEGRQVRRQARSVEA